MQKADYRYYLANGTLLEYSILPDILKTIEDIVTKYVWSTQIKSLNYISVRPDILSKIKIQANYYPLVSEIRVTGFYQLRIATIIGPLSVIVDPNLDFPIFFGSDREYEDNSFRVAMEKILQEETI